MEYKKEYFENYTQKEERENYPNGFNDLLHRLEEAYKNGFVKAKIIGEANAQANVSGQVCPKCNVEMKGATYKGHKMCHICRKWQTVL